MKKPRKKSAKMAEKPAPPAQPGPTQEQTNFCMIREPELLTVAENTRDFLEDAFRELSALRCRMFRERFAYIPPSSEELTLEGILRQLSTTAACLVGDIRTIANKVG